MSRMFIAPVPRCETHGNLTYQFPDEMFVCHGFDGEGCDVRVSAEQWVGEQTWVYVGEQTWVYGQAEAPGDR